MGRPVASARLRSAASAGGVEDHGPRRRHAAADDDGRHDCRADGKIAINRWKRNDMSENGWSHLNSRFGNLDGNTSAENIRCAVREMYHEDHPDLSDGDYA